MLGKFSQFCLLLFFLICFFQYILLKILSESQTVWIQIRPDLIWVQAICQDYGQTTLAGHEVKISMVRVKVSIFFIENMMLFSCDSTDLINTFFADTTKASWLKVDTCTPILTGLC